MLALKDVLRAEGISQAELSRAINLSSATVAQLLNHEQWPTEPNKNHLKGLITEALADKDIAVDAAMFEPAIIANLDAPILTEEVITMLLQKTGLSPKTKKHFGIFKDPFADDLNEAADVFSSPDIRNVREWLWSTARFGGFGAVIGESGAGKSTLRMDLIDRIARENASIIIIEPSVRRSEDNDKKGKTLKSAAIEDAIIYSLDPLSTPRQSPEAKSRQVQRLLTDSRRAGYTHCLIIEEAHSLSIPTLKHLKRFYEIRDGFKTLLSIVLIGQPELQLKLAGHTGDVREVSQRCEIIKLNPLDTQLEEYLRFKFGRVGVDLDTIIDKSALDAIRTRLIFSKDVRSKRETISLMYPLMINNLLSTAMNHAAELGFAKVSAELILEA